MATKSEGQMIMRLPNAPRASHTIAIVMRTFISTSSAHTRSHHPWEEWWRRRGRGEETAKSINWWGWVPRGHVDRGMVAKARFQAVKTAAKALAHRNASEVWRGRTRWVQKARRTRWTKPLRQRSTMCLSMARLKMSKLQTLPQSLLSLNFWPFFSSR